MLISSLVLSEGVTSDLDCWLRLIVLVKAVFVNRKAVSNNVLAFII